MVDITEPLGALTRHFSTKNEDPQAAAQSYDERLAREKPPLSELDGRRLRGKGKNVALNFRVTSDFKRRFYAEAERSGDTMTEVLERAFAMYEAARKGER